MYGGYGNVWGQGSAQWPSANLPNQNQLPIQNQQAAIQQQNYGYGGNLSNMANPSGGAAGMMGYMNMGAGTANPFMNYGGNAAGFGLPPNTTGTNTWLGQQQFQLHQAFPGGRPPLPPGPPPPDVPKDKPQMGQIGNSSQPPLPPSSSSFSGANISNHQRAPPPPPPPPPPSQPPASQQPFNSNSISAEGNMTSATVPGSLMNLEDAYNIIKNAAAYGMLPSCGPLAPLTTLNVSEELFGSKNSNKGIPGLDFAEEDKPATEPGPEVVDLEKEADNLNNKEPSKSALGNNSANEEYPKRSEKRVENNSSETNATHSDKNELKWELRPDVNVKTQEWKRADYHQTGGVGRMGNNGWRAEKQEPEIPPARINTPDNKAATNELGRFKKGEKSFPDKPNPNFVDGSMDSDNRVRIPLESSDGKALVYDRRTLKQFDHKFREWENQFEAWKRSNQNHPNKTAYNQFLDQWNLWRDQLIEQRRSILDKMTKAKLDCKEILMAKFESMDAEDKSTEPDLTDTSSISSQPRDTFAAKKDDNVESRRNDNRSENPFEAALKGTDGGRRPPPPTAPLISQLPARDENSSRSNIPPLLPGLGDKNPVLHGSNNEMPGRDRPVERILRNNGANRSERNIFDSNFGQNQQEKNPFMMNSPFEGKSYSDSNKEHRKGEPTFKSESSSGIPFEWTLPSQNKVDNNPFDMQQTSNSNPFMQPSGPNPFETKNEQRLPSLNDFLQRSNLDFSKPSSGAPKQMESENPFVRSSSGSQNKAMQNKEPLFERIPRDPQASSSNSNQSNAPNKPMRLEANPVGMPLLIAAKEIGKPAHSEPEEISYAFSRDRGPPVAAHNDEKNNFDMDDDFVEDAEVIDYGAGGNSMDSMDFPRGENPDDNNNDDDPDFSLEDTEVIDYSQGMPSHEAGGMEQFSGTEPYGGYAEEFDQGYPPYYGPGMRGRGRGHQVQPPWGRGHSRGPPPGHPFERGGPASHYPPDFQAAPRGRGGGRGMGRGRGHPPPQEWFQHDEREPQPLRAPAIGGDNPEVVELTPSPEPHGPPGVKIAPPNPEFERGERRRSRSRERGPRDRSRSRSRERVSRRGRDDTERRGGDDSPYGSRRERDRDRRSSPDRRGSGRYDERDQRRDRDRFRDRGRRGRSKSRSPAEDRNPVVRNPLFPSASAGMLGAHPASNPPPPRYQTVLIEDILNTPGRSKRPARLVIFMRGLPGSGKSHIVKLIKEREVEMGGKAPRILSLDNYFITEMEKKEKDPVSGVEVKKTVMEYEYDEEREPLYRAQLVRQFKKTLDEGYFSFVIVDCVNEYLRQFEEMAAVATQKRFQVYVAEIEEGVDVCVKRNIHKRTKDEIMKIYRNWERTPSHFVKLDARTLLQDEAIQEVEMEDVSDVEADSVEKALTPAERGKIGPQVVDLEDIEDEDSGDHLLGVSSKWDSLEPSQEKLNKLDGLMRRKRANSEEAQVESAPSIETWLSGNMPEDYVRRRPTQPGQKRVRWADIEEKREQERMREVGFVVGQTDWKRMMDPTFGSSALTRTKFF